MILIQRHRSCLGLLHPQYVPHLLLSNLPPLGIEVDLILDIVSGVESYVGRVRKQLEIHPKNRLLKNQLRTYENYRHQSLLSPLRRLLPELLYQIFETFAPPPSYLNRPDKPRDCHGAYPKFVIDGKQLHYPCPYFGPESLC